MNFHIRWTKLAGILGLAVFLIALRAAAAGEIAGVKVEETARVANQELKLNGAGVRYKAIFKVYVAGLYLASKQKTTAGVMDVPGARRILIVMLRDVGSEEFGNAFMAGIHANTPRAEEVKMITQLQRFGEIFAAVPELYKGDVLTTDWVPGVGTVIHLNGKQLSAPLPGLDFYNAILRIWLGDDPADSNLKPILLGQAPATNAFGF